jgi:hypothetical protein
VRHEALDQATNAFGVPPAPPLPYGSVIQETTASLLDPSLATSTRPRLRPGPIDENVVLHTRFSTDKSVRMFPVGKRDDTLSPFQFKCEYRGCAHTSDLESLLVHFEAVHCRFARLPDPFRMVCPTCERFHVLPSAQCCPRVGPSVVERVYGLFLPDTPIVDFSINAGPVPSSGFGLGLSRLYGMNSLPYSGGQSLLGYVGHIHGHGHGHGLYNNCRSGACMDSTDRCRSSSPCPLSSSSGSMKARLFKKFSPCISFITFPFRKLRQLARGRRYTVAFTAAVLISILFGHDWILSKLTRRPSAIPAVSNLNLPFVGVVFMSIAFVLHRFVVHAHRYTGARPGSWFSRCAIKMFNVACGRPTEPGRLAYELGHSMS